MILTPDQEEALLTIKSFLLNPKQKEMILSGNSGSGKTTLIKYVLDNLQEFLKPTALLLGEPLELYPRLTATTNEAATVLADSSGLPVVTVHKAFTLRYKQNKDEGTLDLVNEKGTYLEDTLLIIDEASMCSTEIRKIVQEQTCERSKIIYVGDNQQLDAVKAECDVFTSGLPEAHLTTNVRQAGNEIAELGLRFRDAVLDGVMPNLTGISSKHIKYVTGPEFQAIIAKKFSKSNYKPDRKILAYSNNRVIAYNDYVRELQNGSADYIEGETLVTNNIIQSNDVIIAKNNSEVTISDVERAKLYDMKGFSMSVRGDKTSMEGFVPDNPKQAKAVLSKFAKQKKWGSMFKLQNQILDLRPRFASTVFKAQGGTLDEVFIDLNDIAETYCSTEGKARALYVAVTRAKSTVYLYGSL